MEKRTLALAFALAFAVASATIVAAAVMSTPVMNNADGTVVSAPDGPAVTITGNFDARNSSGGLDANTIRWSTSEGSATFSSNGETNVTVLVGKLEGAWTNASAIDARSTELTINPDDKRAISVQGDAETLDFRDAALDDGVVDFVVSAPSGSSTVTVRGLPASTTISAINRSTNTPVAVATSDASGVASFDVSHSTQTVLLQEGDQTNSPSISSPSPTGPQSQAPTQLSVNITDDDFPEEDISAEFFLRGPGESSFSSAGTDSRSSPGEVSTTISESLAGEYEWYVEVEDSVGGNTVTSDTYSFGIPDELRIYNESAPDTLINSPTEVTVQFFAEDGNVYERSTTDGTIDFTGLPADEDFVVSASASGYIDRRIYIESLIQQQEIYLLNETIPTSSIVFTLNDDSNQFQPADETTLFIEKPLNRSGSTQYRTITSDQFSATNEVPVSLETGQRYRLRLQGPEGQTRILGAYRATGDDSAVLNVGQVTFEGASATNPSFTSSMQEIDGQRIIRIAYRDPANATESLTLRIVNRTNTSQVLRPETTETGPFGRYVETIPISSTKEQVSYNVTYEATRDGYDDVSGSALVGDIPEIAKDLGVDPNILSMLGYLTILGVLGMTAISYPRYAGIPTVAVAVGLVTLGVVTIPPLLLGGAGVIALVFAAGGAR